MLSTKMNPNSVGMCMAMHLETYSTVASGVTLPIYCSFLCVQQRLQRFDTVIYSQPT
jgi:hypothetical protein